MATQLQNYLVLLSPFVAFWMLLFAGLIDFPSGQRTFFLLYLPFIAVVLFGIYALYTIINGALTIDDCVEAQRDLQKEMEKTRKELKKRGIIDDKDD